MFRIHLSAIDHQKRNGFLAFSFLCAFALNTKTIASSNRADLTRIRQPEMPAGSDPFIHHAALALNSRPDNHLQHQTPIYSPAPQHVLSGGDQFASSEPLPLAATRCRSVTSGNSTYPPPVDLFTTRPLFPVN